MRRELDLREQRRDKMYNRGTEGLHQGPVTKKEIMICKSCITTADDSKNKNTKLELNRIVLL